MVLSKIDLLTEQALAELRAAIAEAYPGRPLFAVSSVTSAGIEQLVNTLMVAVSATRERLAMDADFAAQQAALSARIGDDVLRSAIARKASLSGADDLAAEDHDDTQVVYVRE